METSIHDYVEVPQEVIDFSKLVSPYKTPSKRTKGAEESEGQRRGEPDFIDTVATIMLWIELVKARLPATYILTANSGDETDIRIQKKGSSRCIDLNIKGTKANVPHHSKAEEYGNLAVKAEELGVLLKRIGDSKFAPHSAAVKIEERNGRMWAVGDMEERLPDLFIKVFVHLSPGQCDQDTSSKPHVHFVSWLNTEGDKFKNHINTFNENIAKGLPSIIPGIKHPGLWISSNGCNKFESLLTYLESHL